MNDYHLADFVDLPYRFKGYDFDGVFCWGLVYLFYRHWYQIELPKYEDAADHYQRTEDAHDTFMDGATNWPRIERPQAGLGDVILCTRGSRIRHCGIAITPNDILHIRRNNFSTIERLDSWLWEHQIQGFYRHPRLI